MNLLCEAYLNCKQEIGLGCGKPRGNWIQKLVWVLELTSWTNIYKDGNYLRPTVGAALGLTGGSDMLTPANLEVQIFVDPEDAKNVPTELKEKIREELQT